MKKLVNIIYNNNPHSLEAFDTLTNELSSAGFNFTTKFSNDALVTVCIGGDGAFIRAVHRTNLSAIPIIGINTGHLGFFQEVNPDDIASFVRDLKAENYIIEKMDLIECQIKTVDEKKTVHAINEFAIKGLANKVIHIDVYIDGCLFEKVSGDGVIVSTPIGSTGYNYSCGGSIISPCLKTLQLASIAPISSKAYRSLNNSLIFPSDASLVIRPEYREDIMNVIADGVQFSFSDVIRLDFAYSNRTLNKMVINDKPFWKNVKEKFL
ncbi:MAG: NAD(+)/NADH kinase [Andreesenia angusta]|nr:NAD(+)/NADH kinase [Andreesenia angusta]